MSQDSLLSIFHIFLATGDLRHSQTKLLSNFGVRTHLDLRLQIGDLLLLANDHFLVVVIIHVHTHAELIAKLVDSGPLSTYNASNKFFVDVELGGLQESMRIDMTEGPMKRRT